MVLTQPASTHHKYLITVPQTIIRRGFCSRGTLLYYPGLGLLSLLKLANQQNIWRGIEHVQRVYLVYVLAYADASRRLETTFMRRGKLDNNLQFMRNLVITWFTFLPPGPNICLVLIINATRQGSYFLFYRTSFDAAKTNLLNFTKICDYYHV